MADLCTNLHPSWPSAILPPQISFSSFFFMHRVKVNPNMGIVKLSTTITGAISRGSNGDGVVEGKVVKSVAKTDKKFVHEGSITESLPNGMFRVLLDNEEQILGYLSGKIRKNFVRVLPGDRVRVELSPYDLTKGRIVYRIRNREASG